MIRIVLTTIALALTPVAPALASTDQYVAQTLNAQRAKHGVHAVKPHRDLMAAAELHARDMARNRFMSHTGTDGSSVGQRVRKQGFCYRYVNENIATGFRSPEPVMTGWYNSPSHKRNSLSPKATHYGFAAVDNSWVLVLGRPC